MNPPDIATLAGAVLQRDRPLFTHEWEDSQARLAETFGGATVVCTGGAGFIAGQSLAAILPLRPAKLVLIDSSENGLAALLRDLRSADAVPRGTIVEPVVADVAGPLLPRAVAQAGRVDVLLAFAAVKHLRSEGDDASIAQMMRVNIGGTLAAAHAAWSSNPDARVYAVSTDKAAAPASLMGASKRLMELALLAAGPATSSRFANVAFSTGSLLDSWRSRLARAEPLPVPADTSRFFISPVEAGRLCLLASVAPAGAMVVPAHGCVPEVTLQDAAIRFLAAHGLTAHIVSPGDKTQPRASGSYPVILTPRDTAGEKASEVFADPGEAVAPWLGDLGTLTPHGDPVAALRVLEWVSARAGQPDLPIAGPELDELISQAVPTYAHVLGGNLSDRA